MTHREENFIKKQTFLFLSESLFPSVFAQGNWVIFLDFSERAYS